MNFGAFAGGFSDGFGSGVRMGKTLRDIIKENKMQETLKTAREEAGAAYDAQNTTQDAAKTGMPDQPAPAAAAPATPATEATSTAAPEASAAPAVPAGNPYDPGDTRTDPNALPPSVATQAPASGASSEGNAGEAEARAAIAKPTPQQAAAAGVAPAAAAPAPKPQAAAPTTSQPAAPVQMKADPAARSTYIQKHMAQKAQEYFLSVGDMESAEKYGKYAETLAGKQAIKAWADAKSAPDIDTRAKSFGQYYTDHVNDGVDYVGHKILTKEDGTQVAVVALKDKRTGKSSEMELTDQKMVELGDAWNPAAVFKNEASRSAAAATQKAEIAKEGYKSRLRMGEKAYEQDRLDKREGIKATNAADAEARKGQQTLSEISLRGQIEAQNVGEKAKAELTAKTDALKAAGYTDDEIKPLVPMLLKAGEFKKGTDPAERRAIIGTELMKSDPTFSRATAEEQKARIDKAMSAIMSEPPAAAKPSAPAPAAPVYVRDKTTGQVFKLENGQKVPVGGAPAPTPAPGPASGMPPKSGATGKW